MKNFQTKINDTLNRTHITETENYNTSVDLYNDLLQNTYLPPSLAVIQVVDTNAKVPNIINLHYPNVKTWYRVIVIAYDGNKTNIELYMPKNPAIHIEQSSYFRVRGRVFMKNHVPLLGLRNPTKNVLYPPEFIRNSTAPYDLTTNYAPPYRLSVMPDLTMYHDTTDSDENRRTAIDLETVLKNNNLVLTPNLNRLYNSVVFPVIQLRGYEQDLAPLLDMFCKIGWVSFNLISDLSFYSDLSPQYVRVRFLDSKTPAYEQYPLIDFTNN